MQLQTRQELKRDIHNCVQLIKPCNAIKAYTETNIPVQTQEIPLIDSISPTTYEGKAI